MTMATDRERRQPWGRGVVQVRSASAAWLVLAVIAPWHDVADGRSAGVAATVIVWGWTCWTVVAIAMLVPIPVSLTAVRYVAPLALVVSVVAGSPWAIVVSVAVLLMSCAPAFIDHMVQGGAYGRETRFALRTPIPQMAPAFAAWTILVGSLAGGSLLVAARQLVTGVPLVLVGAVLATRTPRHLHRLSRRWLVIVPAGAVVHDHVVLAETFMVRTPRVASVSVVDSAGEAADLTGGVTGRRLLIAMNEADKIVLSPITARTLGTTEALHVLSFTVAPRRTKAALAALTSSTRSSR